MTSGIPATPQSALGARIRAVRLQTGWSQEGLSILSGVKEMSISRIERGEHGYRPRFDDVVKLAKALGEGLDHWGTLV